MARSQQKPKAIQKFLIIAVALIMIEGLYLFIFSGDSQPVTVREAITKAVNDQPDMTAQRKEQLRVQLALADFRSKNKRYPNALDELVPTYFDLVPTDPSTGRAFSYVVNDGRYSLGEAAKPKLPERAPSSQELLMAAVNTDEERASFVYDPTGKRDPFKPFDMSSIGPGIDPNNPLTAYSPGQLRLTSVLLGAEEPIAIVENSAGRGFTVRKGTKIGPNGGEVVAIEAKKIVIVETATDIVGDKKTSTFEIELLSKVTENLR